MLNLGAGDDRVAFDDTSALLTVNGEDGDDTFQIGQLVATTRSTSTAATPSRRCRRPRTGC